MISKSMRSNLLLILTAFIWGVAFVAQSVGGNIGTFTFCMVRNYIAALVLLPCIKLLDKVSPTELKDEKGMPSHGGKLLLIGGIVCGMLLAIAGYFQQEGIQYTTTGKAGFLTAMYLLIVPLLGIFLKKKVSLKIWICVAVAVLGMYLLCINEGFSINYGDFLVFLCAVCYAVHILVVDYFSPRVDGVRMSFIQFLTCAAANTIMAFIVEQPSIPGIMSAWIPLLYTGALSSAVGFTVQIIAQKDTDPVIASLLMSLESTFALLAGWVLLHQYLSQRELAGCLLMFIAIMAAQMPIEKWLRKSKQ